MKSRFASRIKWGIFLGNLLEHYDTALFGFLSPFLAAQFFPNHDPLSALLMTYAIIPIGMTVRPIGALLLGYVGDAYGRRRALLISLFGMAIVTGLIGFLPTAQSVGLWAPILLSFGRIVQNFFAAGETSGGAVYLVENAAEENKTLISSLFQASTIAGILLASGSVAALSLLDYVENGWRILYWLGALTAGCGILLRFQMESEKSHEVRPSLLEKLAECWHLRKEVVSIAIVAGFCYACYSVSLVMINGFLPLIAPVTKTQMMSWNTLLFVFDFMLLTAFGLFQKKIGAEKMMASAALCAALLGIPLFALLEGAALPGILLVRISLVAIGVWFSAPFHAWTQQLIPFRNRYMVISFAYAIGTQIFGGPTAAISLWIYQQTGIIWSVGCYWVALALLAAWHIGWKQVVQEERYASS